MSILSADYFHDEAAAYRFVEGRLWASGRPCPHCGVLDQSGPLKGKTTRIGLYKCYACRKPFTVKIGTIFESSHIKLHIWLQAIFLLSSSKKGISTNQLHRTLGITLKSAWFLSHRIREAMATDDLPPMGGVGKVVEADETYIGTRKGHKKAMGLSHKMIVMSLVERGGSARSFHIDKANLATIKPILRDNVLRDSDLMTDTATVYRWVGPIFASHELVNHEAEEWVRGKAHTNTIEGFFSVFKRGMKGVYQHCAEKHLHRYLAEFDFRYSNRAALEVNDVVRAEKMLRGVVGKRLTYKAAEGGQNA